MAVRLSREQLHALVWDRPMTKLAAEFSLSDVALHKICRKHDIPTPPVGYWAKKAHGKPVKTTPLPKAKGSSNPGEVVIHEGEASDETEAMSVARAQVRLALEQRLDASGDETRDPILDRTVAKLAKTKPDRAGLVRVEGRGLISVSVRPDSAERAARVLEILIDAAKAAGIALEARNGPAVWRFEDETVSFELAEAADKVEHVPTEAELKIVAKWEAKREADRLRYGYDSSWGRPHIPKWEEHFRGRLAIRLEEVRIESRHEYWGPTIRRSFVDSKTQDVTRMAPRILATVAAIAVAKRENREADERRRLAREEAARRQAEAERLAAMERKRLAALDLLLKEHAQIVRLQSYIEALENSKLTREMPPRVARFIEWAHARLKQLCEEASPTSLEERLSSENLFGEGDR